jgi:hypothetical protein
MEERHQEERQPLSQTEILEVFKKLRLSSAVERERFLELERLGEAPAATDESPFSVRFGDSTTPAAA